MIRIAPDRYAARAIGAQQNPAAHAAIGAGRSDLWQASAVHHAADLFTRPVASSSIRPASTRIG